MASLQGHGDNGQRNAEKQPGLPGKYQLDELISLYNNVSVLTNDITAAIDRKLEPVEGLNQLNFLLEAEFEKVWAMLHTPAYLLNGEPEPTDVSEQKDPGQIDSQASVEKETHQPPNVKIGFYQGVLGAISTKLLGEHSVQKQDVSGLSLRLFG